MVKRFKYLPLVSHYVGIKHFFCCEKLALFLTSDFLGKRASVIQSSAVIFVFVKKYLRPNSRLFGPFPRNQRFKKKSKLYFNLIKYFFGAWFPTVKF
jgi:hypothetical protein